MVKLTSDQIENWVAQNFEFKRRSHGHQLAICNPFDGDNGFHLWISTQETALKKGPLKGKINFWVHDFRPGGHNSSFLGFVKKYRKISFSQAVAEVTGHNQKDVRALLRGLRRKQEAKEVEEEQPAIDDEESIKLPSISAPLWEGTTSKAKEFAINYLYSRKINNEQIERNKLYYTPTTIVFPYFEYGYVVYWQERSVISKEFNFPNESETGLLKTDYIYGFDDAEPHNDLIVVESIFNKLSVGEDCVASGGAILAGRQLQKIRALNPKNVILAPDNDKAGIISLIKNYFFLKMYFPIAYSIPPDNMDWNDMDKNYGVGSARKYIEENTHRMTIPILARMQEQLKSMK